MGRKAKLKKMRQQGRVNPQTDKKYDSTQFVKQFEKMGYQVNNHQQLTNPANRGNPAPEIPQERIEPQL